MLNIGELYHYDKQFDTIAEISNISILGVDSSMLRGKTGSNFELLVKIKDRFIESYASELKSSKLHKSHQVWTQITSVLTNKSSGFDLDQLSSNNAFADLTADLTQWLEKGQKPKDLDVLIRNFEIVASGNLELFSICYGLKVLSYISNQFNFVSDENQDKVVDNFFEESGLNNLTQIHEMVAVCPPTLAPLFQSSEIKVIHFDPDFNTLSGVIRNAIDGNENLNVILTLGVDDENLIKIHKIFGQRLLICTIPESISDSNKINFFAELGLKTIGLSESNIKNEVAKL